MGDRWETGMHRLASGADSDGARLVHLLGPVCSMEDPTGYPFGETVSNGPGLGGRDPVLRRHSLSSPSGDGLDSPGGCHARGHGPPPGVDSDWSSFGPTIGLARARVRRRRSGRTE